MLSLDAESNYTMCEDANLAKGRPAPKSESVVTMVTLSQLSREDALALVDAGYMPLQRYIQLYGA